jgi:hypothetical protein
MQHLFNWIVCVACAALLGFTASSSAQSALPVTKPTTSAMKMTVLPTGEIRISAGKKLLSSGRWLVFRDLRKLDPTQVAVGDLVSSSVENEGDDHALIRDTFSNAKATTDIRFEGEDLHLRVHLQNLDANRPMGNISLHGLTIHFSGNPTGTIPSWHYSYLAAQGLKVFHPSLAEPIGAVFAHDDEFGFSVYSDSEFDRQSLFNAQWQKEGVIPTECQINFFTTQMVPAGDAVDVDVNVRITRDLSIPHLLEGYKRVYSQHFPALLYHPDARPVGQFATVGKNLVTPTNPLGFGGPARRLDSAAGTGAYIRALAPALQNAGAVGMIFWSPGGFSEPMYPPDFDQFPTSVQQNIPALVEGFKKHGLRVGLCARCGDGVTRKSGKQFEMYRLNADDAEQMKTLMDRFTHAIDMGFDMFYLDSFGADDPNDQKILQKIRAHVGKDVLLYTEFCTDLSLPYAGHYCEWRESYILWTSDVQYEALRYLCPDSTWLAISRSRQAVPAVFAKLGLTPLVEDSAVGWLPASRPAR